MKDGIDNDTARACLDLADRLLEKYVGNQPTGRMVRLKPRARGLRPRAPRKGRLYGKHNPVPPSMRAEIVRRARQTGSGYEKYEQIASSLGISRNTVNEICRAAGIFRKPGPVVAMAA